MLKYREAILVLFLQNDARVHAHSWPKAYILELLAISENENMEKPWRVNTWNHKGSCIGLFIAPSDSQSISVLHFTHDVCAWNARAVTWVEYDGKKHYISTLHQSNQFTLSVSGVIYIIMGVEIFKIQMRRFQRKKKYIINSLSVLC